MKVTAAEIDQLILTIPRLNLKQLERVDAIMHQVIQQRLDGAKKTNGTNA